MEKLSVAIITYNEESNIERCLLSVKEVADDIVVLDSFSTDATVKIAETHGARVVLQKFLGHIEQKNLAITHAQYTLVLSLDADEALNERAVEEIKGIKANRHADAYVFNRLNNYCGKWIRHGAWYPDYKLRLWDSRKGKWTGINPHDEYRMEEGSRIEKLSGNILHWSYRSMEEHKNKIDYFSTIAAKAYLQKGKRSSYFRIVFSPLFRFFRDYIVRLGFLDGYPGWIIALYTCREVKLKYKKLLVLQKESTSSVKGSR